MEFFEFGLVILFFCVVYECDFNFFVLMFGFYGDCMDVVEVGLDDGIELVSGFGLFEYVVDFFFGCYIVFDCSILYWSYCLDVFVEFGIVKVDFDV